jgi:hypothetical protein
VSKGAHVLELGAGVGVAGASLAATGAQVLLMDLRTLVNHSTRPNLERNSKGRDKEKASPSWISSNNAVRLHIGWAASSAMDRIIPLEEQISTITLKAVDLVVASNCVSLETMLETLITSEFSMTGSQDNDWKGSREFHVHDCRPCTGRHLQERKWEVECLAWRPVNDIDRREVFLFAATKL